MAGMPNDVRCWVAFASNVGDTAPVYTDLSDRLISADTSMGRDYDTDVCRPGTADVLLDNSDGFLSPRNFDSLYATKVRPMKRLMIEVQQAPFTPYLQLFNGYVDSWARSWPGGGDLCLTQVSATDYFKVLAKRRYSGARPQESAAARIAAVLAAVGIPAAQRAINAPGYASRTLVAKTYDAESALDIAQEAALSDGGLFFQDVNGVLTFETWAYRDLAVRAANVQASFGNLSPSDIEVESNLETRLDDQLLANRVYVLAANGARPQADDAAAQLEDGLLEYEFGPTLLTQAEAEARADQLLASRYRAVDRAFSLTLSGHTGADQLTQSLARRLSDRIALSIRGDEEVQEYFIESVSHSYAAGQSFETTWAISAVAP